MRSHCWNTVGLLLVLWACLQTSAEGQVRLATDGKSKAVIVAEGWQPVPISAFASISVAAGGRDLLKEEFNGPSGQSVESQGWKHSTGAFAVSYRGKEVGFAASAKSDGSKHKAVAIKNLRRPHTITKDAPLTLEYVVSRPVGTSRESWAYVRVHTKDGKRWANGVTVANDGKSYFYAAAEPNDPERVPLPADAGPVLDLKMVMLPTTVRWYWRNHGSDEAYKKIRHWGLSKPVTITGVMISSMNHAGDTNRELADARLDRATDDLRKYLDEVTNAQFRIVGPKAASKGTSRIFVGDSPAVRRLLPDVDWNSLGTDAIVIKTVGNDIVISGGKPRGRVYAIYTFLQDIVGCRWWAPGEISIPSKPNLSIPPTNVAYEPPFRMRVHTSRIGSMPEARSWLRLSYDLSFDFGTHSMPRLLPKKHFIEHPDWFMYCKEDGSENERYSYLQTLKAFQKTIDTEIERNDLDLFKQYIDVARQTHRIPQQACLHSEGARAKITENVRAELEQKYSTWKYPEKIFWITQNDGRYMCQCDKCETVRNAEGSDSANWLLLVNQIAEQLEEKYPDVRFGMFAYLHTEAPPKTIRPRKNVLVYSALLSTNKRDPVSQYPTNAAYLKKWGEITEQFYVWEYDANFRNFYQPHPNYLVHPESMPYFRDIGVTGVLVQGAKGAAADLGPMRAWVNARMMWNPDQDPKQLMKDFTDGYYGAAGPYVLQYINLLLTAVQRKSDYWLGCFRTDTTGWLKLEDINTAVALMEKAATAVRADKTLSRRVWMARRAIDFAWLDRYEELQNDAKAKGLKLRVPDPRNVVDELAPYRKKWEMFREGPRPSHFYVYFDRLRKQFPPASENALDD